MSTIMATYTCTLSQCTRDVCVIHGRPSAAELDARYPHKVGGYDPARPRALCELPNCAVHRHPTSVFGVPLSALKKLPSFDEDVDEKKHRKVVGGYNPTHPTRFGNLPSRTTRWNPKDLPAFPPPNYLDYFGQQPEQTQEPMQTQAPQRVATNETIGQQELNDTNLAQPQPQRRGLFITRKGSPLQLEKDLYELPESDDKVVEWKASHGLESPDRPKEKKLTNGNLSAPGTDEFITLPEWYSNQLAYGNRGRWEPYFPPNRDYISKIFANQEERERAITSHGFETRMRQNDYLPHMFTFGIRYKPQQNGSPESRTVIIRALNPCVKLNKIMSRVRGGSILGVKTVSIGSESMAFIQFVECSSARAYAEYMESNSEALLGHPGRVSLVNTHSYPISLFLDECIKYSCTRHLAIRHMGCPEEFINRFSEIITRPEDLLEDAWVDFRGILFVLFQSVAEAVKFYGYIHRQSTRSKQLEIEPSSVVFAKDPCDVPTDAPAWSNDLARGPYPSLLEDWVARNRTSGSPHVLASESASASASATQLPEALAAMTETNLGTNDQDAKSILKKSPSCSELEMVANMSTVEGDQGSKAVSSSHVGTSSPQLPETHPTSSLKPEPAPEKSFTDVDVHEDKGLLPKYMLPQNDPAYEELLNRDHSDLVSRAEVLAIFQKQPIRAYSKEEIRARYSAFFPIRDMMAAWKRGDMEYDPDAVAAEEQKSQGEKKEDGKKEVQK